MNRSHRLLAHPTPAQAKLLGEIVGACRFVYNIAREQREVWYRQYRANTGRSISYFTQGRELTQLLAEADWLRVAPRDALDEALRELERSYANFFAGRARYPRYRKRSDGAGFTVRGRDAQLERINARWGRVRIPRVGWIKVRLPRQPAGAVRTVSVREDGGRWCVTLACHSEPVAAPHRPASVGIDRGVANTLALSTGEMLSVPTTLLAVDARRRRAQRVLSGRKPGSNRRAKQRARVAALHARARRIRKDWAHRVSTDLVQRFGTIAVEDLRISNLTRSGPGKRGLNRAILHQGWGQIVLFLDYKLAAAGGNLIKVNPAYTSMSCSACGVVDPKSRESQARFVCVECGHQAHADTNAALNILRRSTASQLVEGPRRRPGETRTQESAA